jgi:hypothetical protein
MHLYRVGQYLREEGLIANGWQRERRNTLGLRWWRPCKVGADTCQGKAAGGHSLRERQGIVKGKRKYRASLEDGDRGETLPLRQAIRQEWRLGDLIQASRPIPGRKAVLNLL